MFFSLKTVLNSKDVVVVLIAAALSCGCSQNGQIPVPSSNSTQPSTVNEHKGTAKHSGEASVYADKFQGKKTASGELFDQNKCTAASKTLPLGSKAKVTNKKTGKSTTVTITDRGPYAKGRQIDLSKNAAQEIGMESSGTAQVEIEPVSP